MWHDLISGASAFGSPVVYGYIIAGVFVGYVLGAIPGFNAGNAIAILVPFTLKLDPIHVLMFFAAVHGSSEAGGSWPGIVLNVPGTPSAAAASIEGYQMSKKGRSDEALGVSVMASAVGLVVGAILLTLLTVPLGHYALEFGPRELLALVILGLSFMASMGAKSLTGGCIAVLFGLLMGTVGEGPITGVSRGTFGNINLLDGVQLIPVLIGIFGFSQCLILMTQRDGKKMVVDEGFGNIRRTFLGLRTAVANKSVLLLTSAIGSVIGFIPGLGGSVASWVAYSQVTRIYKKSIPFGTGVPEGVVAAEAANHAAVGTNLLPMLALGLPGTASTAIMMSILILQGITPGPTFLTQHGNVAAELGISIAIGAVFLVILGILLSRYFARIILMPTHVLIPVVALASLLGGYAIRQNVFDVGVVVVFGVVGMLFEKLGLSRPLFLMALILGPMLEAYLGQSVDIGRGSLTYIFLGSPIVIGAYVLTIASLGGPTLAKYVGGGWRAMSRRRADSVRTASSK